MGTQFLNLVMEKPGFIGLRMERACGGTGTGRHPDHYIRMLTPAVVAFSQVVHYLIEPAGYKIGKLHFYHRFIAIHR
jgi:hypothetical protein